MYTIDGQAAWRCYLPSEVPACWRMLGVIHSEADGSKGALAHLPTGVYVQIDGVNARYLDQAAVAAAISEGRPPLTYSGIRDVEPGLALASHQSP